MWQRWHELDTKSLNLRVGYGIEPELESGFMIREHESGRVSSTSARTAGYGSALLLYSSCKRDILIH